MHIPHLSTVQANRPVFYFIYYNHSAFETYINIYPSIIFTTCPSGLWGCRSQFGQKAGTPRASHPNCSPICKMYILLVPKFASIYQDIKLLYKEMFIVICLKDKLTVGIKKKTDQYFTYNTLNIN